MTISHRWKRLGQRVFLSGCVLLLSLSSLLQAQSDVPESLIIKLRKAKNDSERVNIYLQLARMLNDSDKVQSITWYEKAVELEADDSLRASYLTSIGLSWWQLGDYGRAKPAFDSAVVLFRLLQDSSSTARIFNNIGSVYWNLGQRNKALENYQEALLLREATGNLTASAIVMNNIGLIYQDWELYEDALKWHRKAKVISDSIGHFESQVYAYSNIGTTYAGMEKYDSALIFHRLALLTHVRNDPETRSYPFYMNNIGDCYHSMQQYDSALCYYRQSLFEGQRILNHKWIALAQYKLGRTFLILNQLDSAGFYTQRSTKTASQNKYLDMENDLTFLRADIEEKKGNHPLALQLFRKATALKDSLFALKELEDFKRLQIDYYLEQEENENDLLRKNLEIQELSLKKSRMVRSVLLLGGLLTLLALILTFRSYRIQRILSEKLQKNERDLKESNRNKDKFFSIISHDLKSPFNSLLGFSKILEADYDKMEDADRRNYIRLQHRTARQAFNLLESLLQWARTQSGRMDFEFEILPLSEQCHTVCELYQMNAGNKNIQLENLVDVELKVQADRQALETILRNLVSNAIKFTGIGGKVQLEAKQEGSHIVLSVSDNGVGMSSLTQQKIFRIEESFTTQGTDKETGTGLGLILCKELIERQNGRIWLESKEGVGSTFFVRLPSA